MRNGFQKSLLLYGLVLAVFGAGICLALERGQRLERPPVAGPSQAHPAMVPTQPLLPQAASGSIWTGLESNLKDPLSRLFLQLIVILIATRVVGTLFVKIGQPAVVGEMFAGVLLGPSLLGLLLPGAFGFVFPAPSLGTLKLFSQIGVCLFLFVVGMELDVRHLRGRAQTAVMVSHAGILFPYFLGVAASLALFPTLAGAGISFVSFALFMGISMSITAFPVLARILQERRLEKTPLGSTAITCAAVEDVTAWAILALVVAIVRSTGLASTLASLGLVVVFVAVMLLFIRPRLPRWLGTESLPQTAPGKGTIAAVLVFTFLSALSTELIGIHALFGAFLAGVVMPAKPEFREYLRVRLENFSSIFLLPLFFAFTGLRTQVGLINSAEGWWLCLLITGLASVGKLCGCMLTARAMGMPWLEAFSLGALMNTRGLMELIAINIGYDLGILSAGIFTMLVLMALLTTFMTGPLLTLAESLKSRRLWGAVHPA